MGRQVGTGGFPAIDDDSSGGEVQERFRNDGPALLDALKSLCDGDASYHGNEIRITCDSHGDAIKRMRDARAAISRAES